MLYINNLGGSDLGPPNAKNFTIWVNGCGRNCKGCISAEANKMNAPVVLSEHFVALLYKEGGYSLLILSGGEPFLQASGLVRTISEIAHISGEKPPVICYTGNTKEEIDQRNDPAEKALLSLTDLLIDGEYIQEQDSSDRYKGSDNQRMIFCTDRFSPYDFPPMKRSISIKLGGDHIAMSGIPSSSQARAWNILKKEW